jgi:hypothetical protein
VAFGYFIQRRLLETALAGILGISSGHFFQKLKVYLEYETEKVCSNLKMGDN